MIVSDQLRDAPRQPYESARRLPRIVVSGYYGFGNFGDEAILSEILEELDGYAVATVVSENPPETSSRFRVHAVPRNSLVRRMVAISRSDGLLFGGGGLLKEPGSNPHGMVAVLLDLLIAQILGKPTLVYGVGTGEVRKDSIPLLRLALSQSDMVVLRDSGSIEAAISWGVSPERLRLSADVLFNRAIRPSSVGPQGGDSGRAIRIGLSLAANDLVWLDQLRPGRRSDWVDALIVGLEAVCRSGRVQVELLSLQGGGGLTDEELLAEIARRLERSGISSAIRDISGRGADEAELIIRDLDLIVGMRFHALVIACIVGTPFVALGFDRKIGALARDLDLEGRLLDLQTADPQSLTGVICRDLAQTERLSAELAARVASLQARAADGRQALLGWVESIGGRHTGLRLRARGAALRALASTAPGIAQGRISSALRTRAQEDR